MLAQQLDRILDALANAESMVPDPEDRATCARAADVCRRLPTPPRVVLVAGEGTDPVVETVERQAELIGDLADGYRELLDEMRDRRQRITAERDDLRRQLDLIITGESSGG